MQAETLMGDSREVFHCFYKAFLLSLVLFGNFYIRLVYLTLQT